MTTTESFQAFVKAAAKEKRWQGTDITDIARYYYDIIKQQFGTYPYTTGFDNPFEPTLK